MTDQFPDKERERVMEALASKEWANCVKCDWFYRTAVLEQCPMCHTNWKKGVSYQQPAYESSQLDI